LKSLKGQAGAQQCRCRCECTIQVLALCGTHRAFQQFSLAVCWVVLWGGVSTPAAHDCYWKPTVASHAIVDQHPSLLTAHRMSCPILPLVCCSVCCSVTSLNSEWHNVRLAAATPEALAALRQLQQDRDCSVVVLSLYVPADTAGAAAAGADEDRATPPLARQQQQQQRGVLAVRVTGLVRWWELDQGAVYVHVRPCCGRHPAEPSSPCCKVRWLENSPLVQCHCGSNVILDSACRQLLCFPMQQSLVVHRLQQQTMTPRCCTCIV
jgi:hypothetical protein